MLILLLLMLLMPVILPAHIEWQSPCDRTNQENCVLHQTTADIPDLAFHVCSAVATALPPAVVSAGQILSKHLVDHWDAFPSALKDHPRNEFLQKILTPTGVTNLARMRCFYILSLLHQSLDGRCGNITGDKLMTLIQTHMTVFAQMDGTCSAASEDLGLLASGYGSGLLELVRKGKVTIDELTEDAPAPATTQASHEPSSGKDGPAASAPNSGGGDAGSPASDGPRMISYSALSLLSTNHVEKGRGVEGTSGMLFSTESLRELRLLLAADLMMQSRSA